nr:hypothetical protein [Tanacetum cinerariifolium]
MFLNVEQLEKKLDKDDFQEIGSMAAFNVLETQFQMFITSRVYLNDEYVAMTRSYFIQYTQQAILEFCDTLIQHLESVKKSIVERAQLKREYGSWMNERQMQTTEEKVDTSKALNASSVDTESDIRPMYDEEPMDKVQTTAEINVFAIGQQHTVQPEFNNEEEVVQNAEECHDTCPLLAILTNNQIPKHYQSLALKEGQQSQFLNEKSNEAKVKHDIDVIETINIELECKVAKLLKENESLKRHYKELFDSIKITRAKTIEHKTSSIATNDKFKAQLQEKGNQSVVRQPTAFKSERPRISEPRFASQVDVNNDLSKPVTTHYLPKEREAASAKPHHMIASSNSRISSKNMPRFSSNDMTYNHYLEEAKQKTKERSRNLEPSLMPPARSQSTANGSKPKPRSNTQTSRNWHASKNSFIMTKTVPIAEHYRNSRNFSDSKHFVCSTCQQCVFSANHDSCLTELLNEVNLRAKDPSNKTPKRNKPIEQISVPNEQERQIPTGHKFSIQKTFVVQKKTMTPRSCLRWKPTDITNQNECEQTLDVSAGTLKLSAGTSFNPKEEGLRVCSELRIHDHSNEPCSSKLVPKVVPPANKTATLRQELELLFHNHITMLR